MMKIYHYSKFMISLKYSKDNKIKINYMGEELKHNKKI